MSEIDQSGSPSGAVEGSYNVTTPYFSDYQAIAERECHVLYKARRYGRYYVLKGLQPKHRNPAMLEWLYKEYCIGVSLSHPNIVNVQSMEDDPVVGRCIVMEYVEGDTLDRWAQLHKGHNQRREVVRQLLSAVGHLHNHQVCHCDLKPSNILVTTDGNVVKLIDFGLSDGPQYASFKQPTGTISWASPEQKVGGTTSAVSDIYSIGLIMHRLMPREFLFAERHAMRKNPKRRPQTVEELERLLDKKRLWPWVVMAALAVMIVGMVIVLNQEAKEEQKNPSPIDSIDEVSQSEGGTVKDKKNAEPSKTEEKRTADQSPSKVTPSSDDKQKYTQYIPRTIIDDTKSATSSKEVSSVSKNKKKSKFLTDTNIVIYGGNEGKYPFTSSGQTLYYYVFRKGTRIEAFIVSPRYWPKEPEGDIVIPATIKDGDSVYRVTKIQPNAFADCDKITSVRIEKGVKYISSNAFAGCTALKSIEIPDDCNIGGSKVFRNTPNLETVKLPSIMDEIPYGMFLNSGIKHITIPNTVEYIKREAFCGCKNLRSIVLPASVREVWREAFKDCTSLESVLIENGGNCRISSDAFTNCPKLKQ